MPRSHAQIIKDAGNPFGVYHRLRAIGTSVERKTIQQWKNTDNIPPRYWLKLVEAKCCTLEELAQHAERKIKQ